MVRSKSREEGCQSGDEEDWDAESLDLFWGVGRVELLYDCGREEVDAVGAADCANVNCRAVGEVRIAQKYQVQS